MLNKKQNITSNKDWLDAFDKCVSVCSQEHMETLANEAIKTIRGIAERHSNVCSGWIAGKDSIVLDHLMQRSGVEYTPIMWRGVNEYPAMVEWIEKNKPKNLIVEVIDKFNLDYIEKHPDFLFCQGNTRNKWMSAKWERYKKDIPKHGFDAFIVARRKKDGNVCGSKEDNYCRRKETYCEYSPLAEWSHEELLAYIKYNGIELPPFYDWDRGFLLGSVAMGEWTERPVMDKNVYEVWDELYEIDKTIVEQAALKLSSAKKYLESRKNK